MDLAVTGWSRLALLAALLGFGILLRFGRPRPGLGSALGIPWADTDPDIRRRLRHRTGEMLLAWGGWIALELVTGLPASWVSSLWAPLVTVVFFALTYAARLLVKRYWTAPRSEGEERPIPAHGGWGIVILREIVPLVILLVPILVVRQRFAELPERFPAGWSLSDGSYFWMDRGEALVLLRHQTMLVYLLLLGLEGAQLIVTWARGHRGDMARRMLTPGHWLYFLFRVAWLIVFAGVNLGFVFHAARGVSPVPFLLPGLLGLALFGAAVALRVRRRPVR